jgi:hypothetical protein
MVADGVTTEPPVSGSFMAWVTEEGEVLRAKPRGRGGAPRQPAVRARFSRSSLMSFLLAEILLQALSQINSVETRYARSFPDVPRRLRRILLTMPPAMALAEQRIFRHRAEAAVRLADIRRQHDEDLGTADMAEKFVQSLAKVNAHTGSAAGPAGQVWLRGGLLLDGRQLLTAVGNQSNLILDPDLDSYYVMSLSVLRFPELLQMLHDIQVFMLQPPGRSGTDHANPHKRHSRQRRPYQRSLRRWPWRYCPGRQRRGTRTQHGDWRWHWRCLPHCWQGHGRSGG